MEQNDIESDKPLDVKKSNLENTSSKYGSTLSVELSDSSYSSCSSDDGLFSSCFQDARMVKILSSSSTDLPTFSQVANSSSEVVEVTTPDISLQSENVIVKVSEFESATEVYDDQTTENTPSEDVVIIYPDTSKPEALTSNVDKECEVVEERISPDIVETLHEVQCQSEGPSSSCSQSLETLNISREQLPDDEVFYFNESANGLEIVDPLSIEEDEASFAAYHWQMGEKLEGKTMSPQYSPKRRVNSASSVNKAVGVKGGLLMAMNRMSVTFDDYDIIDSGEFNQVQQEESFSSSANEDHHPSEEVEGKKTFSLSKFLPWSKDDKKNQEPVKTNYDYQGSGLSLTGFKNGLDIHYSVKKSQKGETVEEIKLTPSLERRCLEGKDRSSEENKTGENQLNVSLELPKGDRMAKRRNSPVFYDVLGTPELENLGIAVPNQSRTLKKPRSPRSLKKAIRGGSLKVPRKAYDDANADDTSKRLSSSLKNDVIMTGFMKKVEGHKKEKNLSSSIPSADGPDSDFDHVDADMAMISQDEKSKDLPEPKPLVAKVKVRPVSSLRKPVPPPRRKKVRSLYLSSDSVESSADDMRRATLGPSSQTGDLKVDDHVFKGLIPFFDSGDSKRRGSLTPTEKSLLPTETDRLILMTDSYPTAVQDFPEDRRSLIALEMYTTERSFVRSLETITLLFKRKLVSSGHLDAKEMEIVFCNVEEVLALSKNILDLLWKRISSWSDDQVISDIFLDNADGFKVFATYCQNYDTAEAYIKQKLKKKRELENFLNTCYSNTVCQPGLTLPSYLITVVQRIPRYILLLKDLLKRTPEGHPDNFGLQAAVSSMEKIATYINEQLKESQNQKALEALQSQIIGLKDYYISGRTLVYENSVCLMTSKRTYQCVLFNDLMVFAVKAGGRQSEVELVLDLSIVWFEDLEDLDPQTTKQDAIALYTPDRPYTMYVGTRGEKKLWAQNLQKAIRNHAFGKDALENTDLATRNTSYTYKNGAVYSGEFVDCKRHGNGTMMWPNQMTYRGKWLDDERNGTGILEYGTGEVYDGQWKDDKQYGQGKLKYSNLDEFIGEWRRGIRHGQGNIKFQNGDTFEGMFANDRIEGEGKLVCQNGLTYEGCWRRNMKHGQGYLRDVDGNEYRGEFKEDKFYGEGEMRYANGAVYTGSWENSKRQGQGTYKVMGGIVYEGQWLDDMMEGSGKLFYRNGDVYEGTWVQGKRYGNGTMVYSEGSYYNGQWADDARNGQGTMSYINDGKYEGEWKSGRRHGYGCMEYKDSSVYEGEWRDDLYYGNGKFQKPSGLIYEGAWMDNKRNGYGVLLDPLNNYKYEGEWFAGEKEGKGVEMMFGYVYEGDFRNDKRDGYGCQSSPDSTVYEGSWKKGQKHGKGVKKLPNGMKQNQIWQMGCLMESPAMVSRGLPQLERF